MTSSQSADRARLRPARTEGRPMVDNSDPRRAERVALRADIDFRRTGSIAGGSTFSTSRLRLPRRSAVRVSPMIRSGFRSRLELIQGTVCWVKEWEAGVESPTRSIHRYLKSSAKRCEPPNRLKISAARLCLRVSHIFWSSTKERPRRGRYYSRPMAGGRLIRAANHPALSGAGPGRA